MLAVYYAVEWMIYMSYNLFVLNVVCLWKSPSCLLYEQMCKIRIIDTDDTSNK